MVRASGTSDLVWAVVAILQIAWAPLVMALLISFPVHFAVQSCFVPLDPLIQKSCEITFIA
jgi:hypothetical protein